MHIEDNFLMIYFDALIDFFSYKKVVRNVTKNLIAFILRRFFVINNKLLQAARNIYIYI
jgi:hypothetical protein